MTDPKENEELSKELSIDELKSVSGGISDEPVIRKLRKVDPKHAISDEPCFSQKAQGSGSGLTKADWKKANAVREHVRKNADCFTGS
ncbi:hypothetical protein PMIT1313_02395 [Prochlorococcus marinus str. MIT 1313]|uniref:CCRG-2 family RiPP n=1 Tax=Prochlorococcus TaxID=1218 RepID=UPI0007B36B57|nr:CCRG-2 family RiPP [Prochlorococcus marinus]KZR68771.1 hypothetical protein PMIT1313_02395 [Prochlorococcus marinus str. MIT 1313]